jgi:hypothetical protein
MLKRTLFNLWAWGFSVVSLCLGVLAILPALANAQGVSISADNSSPDASSILELKSTSKGMLIPRMTTAERDAIVAPADGLLIYNTTTGTFNFYQTGWQVIGAVGASEASGASGGNCCSSVDAGSSITTISTTDVVIAGMTLTPGAGTYAVNFNSQCIVPEAAATTGFSTVIATSDLSLIYADIMALSITNSSHAATFGLGETITAGVYSVTAAVAITGELTLNGGGNPNSVFVIRSGGAINSGAGANVTLTNGASPENIHWVANGAIGMGAGTTLSGNLISNGFAVAIGASSNVTGRMLTSAGALACSGVLILPTLPSSNIDFRSLIDLIAFTGLGGIANAGVACVYTGDIASGAGAITNFATATVNGTIFQPGSTTEVTPVNHEATFSLYKNGVLIPNSSRTRTYLSTPSDVYLHSVIAVAAGETIEVRWKVDEQVSDTGGQVSVGNRILSLAKAQ